MGYRVRYPAVRLSNTSATNPLEGDNPGKLGIIPYRRRVVEFPLLRKGARIFLPSSARGWAGGLSGSWRGNGPPSRRRVGAVRAGAPRSALRQGPRSYGMHQGRNLRNGFSPDGGTGSALGFPRAFWECKKLPE